MVWACVTLFHIVTYFGSQFLEGEPRTVGWKIDDSIPFLPGFVYIYCSWFPLLLLVPLLLNVYDSALCGRYFAAMVFDLTISTVIYLLMPTTFERPEITAKGLTGFAMRTVYGANHRFLNCAPSLHCSAAMLFAICMAYCTAMPFALRGILFLLSLGIVASTVLVKQHVLVDVLTAIPTIALCWVLSGLPCITALIEKLLA